MEADCVRQSGASVEVRTSKYILEGGRSGDKGLRREQRRYCTILGRERDLSFYMEGKIAQIQFVLLNIVCKKV